MINRNSPLAVRSRSGTANRTCSGPGAGRDQRDELRDQLVRGEIPARPDAGNSQGTGTGPSSRYGATPSVSTPNDP
ncbi:hypothetical protein ACXJJ3_06715 [Kribbella sp. WER1]